MNRKQLLVLFSLVIIVLMATTTTSGVSAATVNKNIDGKGAIAQFSVSGPGGLHTIDVIVSISNSGKEGQIYISIVHPLIGMSSASGPVNVEWSMNHVTAETTLTFTGAAGRVGTHNIAISWQTDGPTSNKPFSVNTGKGLVAEIEGAWKLGIAELSIKDSAGRHIASDYTSSWAIVAHGTADVTLTL